VRTKKFVRTEVGNVNTKVDTLSGSLEETQERTRKNEERIGAVDTKAEAAGRSAQEARGAADAAAQSARQVNTRVDQVQTELNTAVASSRKLVYEVTLSEDQGQFKSGKFELPDTRKARLDEVIGQLKADTKNVFIEIEGTRTTWATRRSTRRSAGARRSREAVSLRAAPDSAAQDERDQLRRGEADCAEHQPRRPRAEPPRRREGSVVRLGSPRAGGRV
jgi:uncharacterized coiled-coil DUF342 family protein